MRRNQKLVMKDKIDKLHVEIGKTIQQRKVAENGNLRDDSFFKSMLGVFYKNYSVLINSDSDSKLLPRLFSGSKILSDLNKNILYLNLPYETILKERHLPQ